MSIWFVTPVWGRVQLTAVCLLQRRLVIDELATHGVEARCVVVGDDANLSVARELGFDVVEQDNEYLGRKFNDGIEHAARAGATWVVPIGSDSWIDPAYFLPLPAPGETRTSACYAAVTADRIGYLRVLPDDRGAGPYLLHRDLLEPSGFRPADDLLRRYIDSSTVRGLAGPVRWVHRDVHEAQYIGFRGTPTLTPYQRLVDRWGTGEADDPWQRLALHYPSELVDAAREALR